MEPVGVPEFVVGETSPHVPDYKEFWNIRHLIKGNLLY